MKLISEAKERVPFYRSDFLDAFSSFKNLNKTISSSLYILFTSIAPAITFSTTLISGTGNQYGVVEVLFSTALTGFVYSLLSGQPLVIVGVTGPVSIYSQTLYYLVERWFGGNCFLPFMFWVSMWGALFHIIIALFGLCDLVKQVTRFSYESFGALIGIIYLYEAIKEMVINSKTTEMGILTLLLALGTLYVGTLLRRVRHSVIFTSLFRNLVSDYAVPLTVVALSSIYYLPSLHSIPIPLLQVSSTFAPTNNRFSWIIDPLALPLYAIPTAIIPGIVLTVLFFFDHNVSSILAQESRFHLKKPSAYNWDFLIIGLNIILTGILGLPPTNGLIPQGPLHVRSLAFVEEQVYVDKENPHIQITREVVLDVVEQRVSNLMQSILTGVAISVPAIRTLLGSVPVAVLNGLFLIMGIESFEGNQFGERLFVALFVTEKKHRLSAAPNAWPQIKHVKSKYWYSFTLIQTVTLGIIFGITLTPGAICFPILIILLVPLRSYLFPKFFPNDALIAMDSVDKDKDDSETSPNYLIEIESLPGHHPVIEIVDQDSQVDKED